MLSANHRFMVVGKQICALNASYQQNNPTVAIKVLETVVLANNERPILCNFVGSGSCTVRNSCLPDERPT